MLERDEGVAVHVSIADGFLADRTTPIIVVDVRRFSHYSMVSHLELLGPSAICAQSQSLIVSSQRFLPPALSEISTNPSKCLTSSE
jgi:hypothetical protein